MPSVEENGLVSANINDSDQRVPARLISEKLSIFILTLRFSLRSSSRSLLQNVLMLAGLQELKFLFSDRLNYAYYNFTKFSCLMHPTVGSKKTRRNLGSVFLTHGLMRLCAYRRR